MITPSNIYNRSPFNARQGLIWCSMLGIPLCWAFSYLLLYFYFVASECKMRFIPSHEVYFVYFKYVLQFHSIQVVLPEQKELTSHEELDIEDEKRMQSNRKCLRHVLTFFDRQTLHKARTAGWWEDLNELTDTEDKSENENEEEIDDSVKKTFSYWRKSKKEPLKVPLFGYDRLQNKSKRELSIFCLKYVVKISLMILFLFVFNLCLDKFING